METPFIIAGKNVKQGGIFDESMMPVSYTHLDVYKRQLDAIKIIISSKEVGSQEELLQELAKEGFQLTQATLSRDLKQLKVALFY